MTDERRGRAATRRHRTFGTRKEEGAHLAILGAGPRGFCCLERLVANLRATPLRGTEVHVHVIDPRGFGAGAVWRPDQPGWLKANTVAGQITVYPDESVACEGPITRGPSMYEWLAERKRRALAGLEEEQERRPAPNRALVEKLEASVRRYDLGPDDYPSRGLYGEYLGDQFDRTVARLPEGVRLHGHGAAAVDIEERDDGRYDLHLAEYSEPPIVVDKIVLATGHSTNALRPKDRAFDDFAARHPGLTFVPCSSPVDMDLSGIGPDDVVAMKGMGLVFYDLITAFTVGRGGRYETRGGEKTYVPSGREPEKVVAGSRRGLPYLARGENQKGVYGEYKANFLTTEKIAELRQRAKTREGELGLPQEGKLDFGEEVWPLVRLDVEYVYYSTLLRETEGEEAAEGFARAFLRSTEDEASKEALLDEYVPDPERRFDWERVTQPFRGKRWGSPEAFRAELRELLVEDLREARKGNVRGPLKAALDVLRDLRNKFREAVEHGGLTARSHKEELAGWFTPTNALLSIGPPAFRVEELVCLMDAGLVEVVGPEARFAVGEAKGRFVVWSEKVEGSRRYATALVDARVPEPDLKRDKSPLMQNLQKKGMVRPHVNRDGYVFETGGVDVTPPPFHVVDAEGRENEDICAFGIPTEHARWVTAAGARPGVNSVMIRDADAIAVDFVRRLREDDEEPAAAGRHEYAAGRRR